jgi:hypothetical protein
VTAVMLQKQNLNAALANVTIIAIEHAQQIIGRMVIKRSANQWLLISPTLIQRIHISLHRFSSLKKLIAQRKNVVFV